MEMVSSKGLNWSYGEVVKDLWELLISLQKQDVCNFNGTMLYMEV